MSWGTVMSMAMLGGTLAPNSSASLLAFGSSVLWVQGGSTAMLVRSSLCAIQCLLCSTLQWVIQGREGLSHIEPPHHFVAF